jgi:hypothetical protein
MYQARRARWLVALVKIDNIHNDKYAVNVYGNDDCTGPIVGAIQTMNCCLNSLHASSNTVGKSLHIVPVSKESETPTSKSFETDYLYNLPAENDEHMEVPIAHGLFRRVDKASHAENGAYVDGALACS